MNTEPVFHAHELDDLRFKNTRLKEALRESRHGQFLLSFALVGLFVGAVIAANASVLRAPDGVPDADGAGEET